MGTNINNKLQSVPFLSYGYEYGNSPMTNAAGFQKNMINQQTMLNQTHGGSSDLNRVIVPQFSQVGPNVSPIGANSFSLETNTTSINGQNNALNDCWATNSCDIIGGSKRRKTKKHRKTKKTKKHRKTKKN